MFMQSLTYRRVALVIETNDPQCDPADEDMKQLYEDLPDTLLILEDQVYTEQNSRHFRIKFLLLFIGLYMSLHCVLPMSIKSCFDVSVNVRI
jgi:hypothetical protein